MSRSRWRYDAILSSKKMNQNLTLYFFVFKSIQFFICVTRRLPISSKGGHDSNPDADPPHPLTTPSHQSQSRPCYSTPCPFFNIPPPFFWLSARGILHHKDLRYPSRNKKESEREFICNSCRVWRRFRKLLYDANKVLSCFSYFLFFFSRLLVSHFHATGLSLLIYFSSRSSIHPVNGNS